MSQTHDIDNQQPLFDFDLYEAFTVGVVLEGPQLSSVSSSPGGQGVEYTADNLVSHTPSTAAPANICTVDDDAMSHESYDNQDKALRNAHGKGKGVPMPIRTQGGADTVHDTFDMHLPSSILPSRWAKPLASPTSPSASSFRSGCSSPPNDGNDIQAGVGSLDGKGKAREQPPSLPPLSFSPTEFGYDTTDWPSPAMMTSTSGPSSYGSTYGPISQQIALTSISSELRNGDNSTDRADTSVIRRLPSRRRSLSNLSIHSTRSLAARSMSRIKVRFGTAKGPSNLARKLFGRKHDSSSDPPSPPEFTNVSPVDLNFAKVTSWQAIIQPEIVPLTSPIVSSADVMSLTSHPVQSTIKGKGRSYSSPFPMSAFDFIPQSSMDCFVPFPIIVTSHFEESLPRELKLHILSMLVYLYEAEHRKAVKDGQWTAKQASSSKNKWLGRDKGVRELMKLSRVSKSWRSLVYDGQLWSDLQLRSFPRTPPAVILRVAESAGHYIKTLDITGHVLLQSNTLTKLTDHLCLGSGLQSPTQLTSVNLQGCSALTAQALHYLLTYSPSLQTLCLKGLSAVTNTTCNIISTSCLFLTSLNLSRCKNVDGEGIYDLATNAPTRGGLLGLKEFRLAGLAHFNDNVLAALGRAAPNLEVLDLSYIRTLHNSSLEAFVSCDDEEDMEGVETIVLSAREIGRDPADTTRYRRRVTRLRHLALSSCLLLTDIACANLAHTMPRLEYLELAGIGTELKDNGLILLLNTTPLIRKLDLEDASAISDNVLAVITPPVKILQTIHNPECPSHPGHKLEHLIVSYAANITDNAFYGLISGCTHLRVLEADNTRMSSLVVREFVRTVRTRGIADAKIIAVDCRGVSEGLVRDLAQCTRPRLGWRAYSARKLAFVDARDAEELSLGPGKVLQDECDERRVVLKSFYSWQMVDAVRSARDKVRKLTHGRRANESTDSVSRIGIEEYGGTSGRARWWSPGGRRTSGYNSPMSPDNDREGCRIM